MKKKQHTNGREIHNIFVFINVLVWIWTECYFGIHRLHSSCPSLSQKRCDKERFGNVMEKHPGRGEEKVGREVHGDLGCSPTAGQHHNWELEGVHGLSGKVLFVLMTCGSKFLTLLSKCSILGMPCVWAGRLQPGVEITTILDTKH